MVAKTRSQTKREQCQNSRKNTVWELVKLADTVRAFVDWECDLSTLDRIDMPEISLAISVLPLSGDDRKLVIDSAEFYAYNKRIRRCSSILLQKMRLKYSYVSISLRPFAFSHCSFLLQFVC